jgi:uncharacterized protein
MNYSRETNPPLIFQFEIRGHNFVLDLHTNRLFSLNTHEAIIIQKWCAGTPLTELSEEYPKEIKEIKNLQEQGLFCNQSPSGLAFGEGWDAVFDQILHERVRTVLEITQRCNLRCNYCTFGGGFVDHRIHNSKVMSEETLKKAINEAFTHSDYIEEISIGFYGGEPLLPWGLLKTAVCYAQSLSSSKQVRFSITTNATLVDEKKAQFLKDAGFSVLVSLDGPKFLHDQHRIYPNGKGSYTDTVRGLKILLDVYPPEMHEKIGLNMVIPSYSWMPYLERLWDEEPWLHRTLRAQATMVSAPDGFLEPDLPANMKEGNYRSQWLNAIEMGTELKTTLGKEIFDKAMAKIHQRPRFRGYRRNFFPNGCCIPGTRKIYVQAGGSYQICERVHGVPNIGSVRQGVNLSRIKQIVEEYSHLSFRDCKTCFAISTCTLCFLHAYESGQLNIEKKRLACSRVRRSLVSNLKMYGLISKIRPQKLDEWDEVVIL